MRRLFPALLALSLLLLPTGSATAQETHQDDWAVVRISGQPVGWARTRLREAGTPEAPLFETTAEMEMTMKRMGAEIRVAQKEVSWERPDGSLVRIESTQTMSANPLVREIRFEPGKAIVKTTVAGVSREDSLACPDGVVGPYYLERRTRETGFEPGASFEALTFSIDLGGARKTTVTVVGPEKTTLLDGTTQELVRIDSRIQGLPFEPSVWYRPDGTMLKTVIPIAGLQMEMYAASREQALAAAKEGGELSPDVFNETLVEAPHDVPRPRRANQATLLVRSKKELPEIPASAALIGAEVREKTLVVRQRRALPPDGHAGRRPLTDAPAEVADALAPNSMIQSDAAEIVAIATQVVGDETDAWKAAQILERWVHDNLTSKNMDVGFATALEVCRDRSGDCTEHAVFLAALCRAAGIPSKVVMGLVYIGRAWGGHAWNEVWIDGAWYPLDATMGYGSVDPLHLPLGSATLSDTGFGEEFIGMVGSFGNLSIEVEEVRLDGRTLRPGAADAAGIEEGRYVNRLWGFSCGRPGGYEFDLPGGGATLSARLLELDGKTASGKGVEIEIAAHDAPADGLAGVRGAFERRYGAPAEIEVDERRALRFERDRGDRGRILVLVVADDVFFTLEIDRVEGDAEREAFDAFLASVDFDVE